MARLKIKHTIEEWKKALLGSERMTPPELQGLPRLKDGPDDEPEAKPVAGPYCLGGTAHRFEKWDPPDENGFEYQCHICQAWLDPAAPSEDQLRERGEDLLGKREISKESPKVKAGRGWRGRR